MASMVLALHGFTGTGDDFAPVADGAWITPDIVGHGAAPAPRDVSAYAMAAEVQRLALRIEPGALLIGYSMGGRLALSLAVALSEADFTLGGLVLIGATPGIADPAERAARRRADVALAERIEAIGVAAFLAEWQRKPIIASQQRIAAQVRAAMDRRKRRHRPWGLANSLRGMGTGAMPSLWPRLSTIRCPTLLVVGAEDAKFGAIADRMADAVPAARVERLPAAGHCAHLEAPAQFRERLAAWRTRRGV